MNHNENENGYGYTPAEPSYESRRASRPPEEDASVKPDLHRRPYVSPRYQFSYSRSEPRHTPPIPPQRSRFRPGLAFLLMGGLIVSLCLVVLLSQAMVSYNRNNGWETGVKTTLAPIDSTTDSHMVIVDIPKVSPTLTVDDSGRRVLSVSEIAKKMSPSVVSVMAGHRAQPDESSGSGIVMSADGLIITNNHVVEGYDRVTVVLDDGGSYEATMVRRDALSDLAVVKIDAKNLTPAEFGNSDQLEVGDTAVAIGNPLGTELKGTVTNGIISAINRDIIIEGRTMTTLQTNCAINPGNSGGPLINEYGQVVGIISSKIIGSYYSEYTVEGLGFAIPINYAQPILEELISRGYVKGRPALGITGYSVDAGTAQFLGIPFGVKVESVNPSSDAAAKGLKKNDVITKVNGQEVRSIYEINAVKEGMEVGETLTVTVYRLTDDVTLDITFALVDAGELPEE